MLRLSILLGLLALPLASTRAQPYETDSLTVALYHLDDSEGSLAHDASGNELHASVFGGTWISEGKFGGGIVLDGDDNLLVPATDLLPTLDLTLEAWVFRGAEPASVLIDCRGFGFPLNDGPYLGIDASGRAYTSFLYGHVGIFTVTGTSQLPSASWVHVAGVFAGKQGRMGVAVNGVVEAQSIYNGAPIGRSGALVGAAFSVGGDPHFAGRLDEIRISRVARFAIPTDLSWASHPPLTLQVIHQNGDVHLRFSLPDQDLVTIGVYDVRGRAVGSLYTTRASAGPHEIPWNVRAQSGAEAAAGIYIVKLSTGSGDAATAKLRYLH